MRCVSHVDWQCLQRIPGKINTVEHNPHRLMVLGVTAQADHRMMRAGPDRLGRLVRVGVRRKSEVEQMFQPLEFGGFCLPIPLGFFTTAFPLAVADHPKPAGIEVPPGRHGRRQLASKVPLRRAHAMKPTDKVVPVSAAIRATIACCSLETSIACSSEAVISSSLDNRRSLTD